MNMIPMAMAKPPDTPSSPGRSSHNIPSGKRSNHLCWSNIPLDLIRLVFERLGFADFERAKCVCHVWLSASKESQPNNMIPWLFQFPQNSNHVLLFNPEEKDKVYKTQDLCSDFAESSYVASCKSRLLMLDPQYTNLYTLDLITRERINLPTLEANIDLASLFWINEETNDHLIICMVDDETVVSIKKGDTSWKHIPQLSCIKECEHMVYKDHKLYCLNFYKLKIFDFSGNFPRIVFKISLPDYIRKPTGLMIRKPGVRPENQFPFRMNSLVVTLGGDVLIVRSERPAKIKIWSFKIYKMDSSKANKWEEIVSVGDEAIILGLGTTVLAKDIQGFKRNSIYFTDIDDPYCLGNVFIYDLGTKMVERPHLSVTCSHARWLIPSFKRYD